MPGFAPTAGTKVGLEIWRIEKLEVNDVPKAQYGSFFSGDCYLVMNTYDAKDGRRYQDLHFWLGKDSSQDEQGAAAYKTVELDTKLGGKPVQHREVQGYESPLFLSYFPKGIIYQEGGIASGFRKVDKKTEPRLFHVKGKRNVRVQQVELKGTSLNNGDVFVLDAYDTIYQWNGAEANKYEKFKGLEIVTKIKNEERGGKCETVFLEAAADKNDAFWKILGGRPANIKSAQQGGDDDGKVDIPNALYRISDSTGKLAMTKVSEGKLEQKSLDKNDVFLVDSGSEVFVWVGSGATKQERDNAMKYAATYLQENKRPAWVPCTRVVEKGEPPAFRALFYRWEEPKVAKIGEAKAAAPDAKAAAPDVKALYAKAKANDEKLVDDGSGKVTVWRIQNMKKVELPAAEYGQFFSGDAYIVLYEYKRGTKTAWIIYFWLGNKASNDEKGAAALLTVDLDDALGGEPVQVRVTQGREPEHFVSLFKGKMVVHDGGFASAFVSREEKDQGQSSTGLYHVRGTKPGNTRAVQIACETASLSSNDVFVLNTPAEVFVWDGKGASAEEKKVGATVAPLIGGKGKKVTVVAEGSEPANFWVPLGGKGEYASSKELETNPDFEARLFQCTTAKTGAFRVEQIFNFTQDDLVNDDVYILDAYSEVFVWVGHDATKEEKDHAFAAALDFVAKAQDGRPKDTPVYKLVAGAEPPNFTCHFLGWDLEKGSNFSDKYADALNKMGQAKLDKKDAKDNKAAAPAAAGAKPALGRQPTKLEAVTAADIGFLDWKTNSFPIAQLQGSVPPKVDPAKREFYLSDAEFQNVFKMNKEAWLKVPDWKKKELKKAQKLF